MACSHARCQLCLRQAKRGTVLDHETRDLLERRQPLLLGSILAASTAATATSLRCVGADRACSSARHLHHFTNFDKKSNRQGASCPAARGGRRRSASIRSLKSAHRSFALADLGSRKSAGVFSERMEENNQISRPNVEHAIELRPVVTP